MRRLHVALVHPYSWPEVRRGGERYLAELAEHLVGGGHAVDVITGTAGPASVAAGSDGSPSPTLRRYPHIEHVSLTRRGAGPVETFGLVALRGLLSRRYDVVHALTPTAALAGRLSGHRTLYTVLGQPDRRHFDAHPTERRLTAAAVRSASEVAVLSRCAARVEEGVFGRRVLVLPPGVRTDRFTPGGAPGGGPPRLLFPADASDRRKRVDLALGALAVLLRERPDARLLLAGPGDHRWALDAIGADRDVVVAATDAVGVGRLEELPARYRDATVTVLPSSDEAFGLAVVESLACGTPVACLPGSGPEEILSSADAAVGSVAAGTDVESFAGAVRRALELTRDPQVPQPCATHARRWDWSRVGLAHEEVYAGLARGRRRRDGAAT